MFKNLGVRFGLIAALVALSAYLLVDRGIVLGLDLQGGTHLALELEEGAVVEDRQRAIEQALAVLRTRIDELGVAEPSIQRVGTDRIVVELPGIRDEGRARDVIQRAAFLQFQIVQPVAQLERAIPRMDRAAIAALGEDALRAELPEPPADEDLPDLFGPGQEEVADDEDEEVPPAADDPAAAAGRLQPLGDRILPSGGDFMVVAAEDVAFVERLLAIDEVRDALPAGTVVRWGHDPRDQDRAYRELYLLTERAIMTGEHLEDAQAMRDPELYQPLVTFQLTGRGGRDFERATGRHVGDQMAIVLDERVISAPTIRSRIGRRGQIEMGQGTSMEETRDLALILRAGALPAPLQVVEERSVGPSLGADSVQSGQFAGLVGLALVVLIILGYYKLAGLMAVIALSIYLLLLLGGLALINATLTLPGIAGLILSIGMAVDANVLIFERIREEIDAGRSARVSINEGFQHALSAIVDASLTTLITAFILFYLGTGPVRGFAVTLSIGIIASMFTALFVTRTFFMVYLTRLRAGDQVSI